MSAIGARLRMARWSRGMTQADVARALGVSHQSVGKYEEGEGLSAEQLVRIAGVLGISPAWLLDCGEGALFGRDAVELAAAYERLPERARSLVRGLVCELDRGGLGEPVGW